MASTRDWLPPRLADQADVFENVINKLPGYAVVLGLTPAQLAAIIKLCSEFINAFSYTEQVRAGALATVQWRDQIFKGTPQGTPAGDPPAFPTSPMPVGSTIGVLAQFRDFRDIMLAAPGYTDAIGQDLMLVGTGSGTGPSIPVADATPEIKTQVGSGYEVTISGPMHGMDAMRIEYQRNGEATWNLVGFLTRTPGHVIISPHTPGEPEAGRIRARYIKNNVPVGNYSQEAAVTVSA